MKIAIIIPNEYPVPAVRGGAVEGLVEQLLDQNEVHNKLDITVFSPYDEKAEAEAKKYKNSKVIYIRKKFIDKLSENKAVTVLNLYYAKYTSKSLISYPYINRIIREIAKKQFDLIICEGGNYIQYKALSDYVGNKRMILHYHGEVAGNIALKNWFAHHICVSSYIGRKLIENGCVSASSVDILLNGVPTEKFIPTENDRYAIRSELGFTTEDIILIYWGRMIPQKGVRELIDAFKVALSQEKRLRLVLFGGAHFGNITSATPYEQEVVSLCKDCEQIRLNGFIENKKLQKYISACDIAVLPSIWDEPAGLAMLEAACVGIPLITTGTGGMKEYIKETGHVFVSWYKNFVEDLATTILEVAKNPEFAHQARENAEYYRNKFNSSRYYFDYVELMEKYQNKEF